MGTNAQDVFLRAAVHYEMGREIQELPVGRWEKRMNIEFKGTNTPKRQIVNHSLDHARCETAKLGQNVDPFINGFDHNNRFRWISLLELPLPDKAEMLMNAA